MFFIAGDRPAATPAPAHYAGEQILKQRLDEPAIGEHRRQNAPLTLCLISLRLFASRSAGVRVDAAGLGKSPVTVRELKPICLLLFSSQRADSSANSGEFLKTWRTKPSIPFFVKCDR